MSYVWKVMRTFKNTQKSIEWCNWNKQDRKEIILKEIQKLAPPHNTNNFSVSKERTRSPMDILDEDFSMEELDRAINMIKRNSAPGRDGVEYKMIKELPLVARCELLKIFNQIWNQFELPQDWKNYQVLFIDKPGKNKVRPIALSSCVGKIMERLVNERLVWWAEHYNKLAEDQNGFRRGRSCADNLTKIVCDIKIGLFKSQYTMAAFLDVSSAYDNVVCDVMFDKLKKIGCPLKILTYIGKWLIDRDTEFVIDSSESYKRIVRKGLPQGAVLSPILYALYTNDLTYGLDEEIKTVQFADDIAIYITSSFRQYNKCKLEQAIDQVACRLKELGLDLAPNKTSLIEFNQYGIHDVRLNLKVMGINVSNNKEVKFLGVWLDNKLNFNKQVHEIRGKVNKVNSLMTYLNSKSKGLEVNTALGLYKSLVRSRVDYGCFIYYPNNKELRLKMERCQFLGVRIALGLRNSTPNNVTIAEAKVRLLRDRADMLARNFLIKNLTYGSLDFKNRMDKLVRMEEYARFRKPGMTKSIITESWKRIKWFKDKVEQKEKFEIFSVNYSIVTNKVKVDLESGKSRKVNEKMKDSELLDTIFKLHKIKDDATIIYTDGARQKKGKSTGASIVIENQEVAYNISMFKECSSYTAEAFAIKAALEVMVKEGEERGSDIIILSDAKSVLQAISNNLLNVYTNKYIVEIKEIHNKLVLDKGKRIIYVWIPGHRGIKGNEMADKLAKEATLEEHDASIKIPVSDLNRISKIETWCKTQDIITQEAAFKGKEYFSRFYNRNKRKSWFNKLNKERYYITLQNRIRSNHYNLNDSLFRKGYIDSARCECGIECESLYHFVWQCSKYDDIRIKMDERLRERGIDWELDILEVIRKQDWVAFNVIYKYIKETGRII